MQGCRTRFGGAPLRPVTSKAEKLLLALKVLVYIRLILKLFYEFNIFSEHLVKNACSGTVVSAPFSWFLKK